MLSGLFYQRYLHRCDPSPDVGPELRRLVRGWRYVAGDHSRQLSAHLGDSPEDVAAYNEHQTYWLAYESCARRLEALIERAKAGAATARACGSEESMPGPVRRVGGDSHRHDERLARRLDGHLARPGPRGSFPGEKK